MMYFFGSRQQPETKNKGLTDHVENKDIELEDVQKTQKD
jgi:hypothetical protein